VIPSFLAIRLALGACAAPEYPSSGRMNANWMPLSHRARVWGWIASGAGIGGAFSPLLFTWMSGRYGWRGAFWISAVASAILSLVHLNDQLLNLAPDSWAPAIRAMLRAVEFAGN
jgi:ACS family D-galactonate transporter-like MFS transporter